MSETIKNRKRQKNKFTARFNDAAHSPALCKSSSASQHPARSDFLCIGDAGVETEVKQRAGAADTSGQKSRDAAYVICALSITW